MFQGTGKKEFDCHRCQIKDERRKFLNGGQDYERVEFGEIDPNSRSPSPNGYGNIISNYANHKECCQQENNSPQQSHEFRDRWMQTNYDCKRCWHHHQVYSEKMEYPVEQPEFIERGEYGTRPRKPRRASPKGKLWTPDALRGVENHSPSPKGGRYVSSHPQRLSDKRREENLSLRFSDMSMTQCAHCLHHHGFDPTTDEHDLQPDHDQYLFGRGPPLFGSKGNLEAKISPQKVHDGAWWKNSEEKYKCRRCSSHHKNHEGLLRSMEETKRSTEENHSQRVHRVRERNPLGQQPTTLDGASPEFVTPREEFPRSRTPTPQRSYNYRELYERKIQGGGSPSISPTYELRQMWKPPRKTPKYDIEEYLRQCKVLNMGRNYDNKREGSPNAWTQRMLNERKEGSPGRFSQHHKSHTTKDVQLMMKNVDRAINSTKSPKWSKECLHKRELMGRTNRRAPDKVPTQHKRYMKNGINYGNISIGRTPQPINGHGKMYYGRTISPKFDKGLVYRSEAQTNTSNLTKEYKTIITSRSKHEEKRKAMILEEQESRWAPPPNWTTRQLNAKELKGRSASPKKFFKVDGEVLRTKVNEIKENLNLNTCMNFGDTLWTDSASKSTKWSPSRKEPTEISSREEKRHGHSPHKEKSNIDYKFEVINVETTEFEERNPNSSRPDSCRPGNSSPIPKQIYLRIPNSMANALNDKDQKVTPHGSSSEKREKPPMSKRKCERDVKLRIEIRSELPLDVVDGRLKQFLKGMGGLIYYSPKDGGIPRIKELANYFSGKQPLLWFFPRST